MTDAIETNAGDELTELPVRFLFTLAGRFSPPLQTVGGPQGDRWVFGVAGGEFDGPDLRGTVEPQGGDWVTLRKDKTFRADVRLTLRTDDGAIILMTFSGIGVPEHGHYTVRIAPQFETGDERYHWLNNIQAIGMSAGRRPDQSIAYDVYALL